MKKILFGASTWILFSALGVYRGRKCYNFKLNQSIKSFEKREGVDYKEISKGVYWYNYETHPKLLRRGYDFCGESYIMYYLIIPVYHPDRAFLMGIMGFLFYANPISGPFMLYNEIYRLVINLQCYDNEKEINYEKYYKRLYSICPA